MKRFDFDTHTYYINEKSATGVTTVIGILGKPALIQWAANMAIDYVRGNAPKLRKDIMVEPVTTYLVTDEILDEAKSAHRKKKESTAEHGTDAHKLVEEYIRACIDSFDGKPVAPKEEDAIKKFTDWAVENVEKFLFSERIVIDEELFLGGTIDFGYVDKEGKRVIADFKTSSGIYFEMWLQTAAYQLLAEREGDEAYDYRTVVRLGKNGKFETAKRIVEEDKKAFLALLEVYRVQSAYNK